MKKKFDPLVKLFLLLLLHNSVSGQTFTLLKDINPGSGGTSYFNFTKVNNTLFFRPDDGEHGAELWKTNGTVNGTVLVKDIYPGETGSEPDMLTNVNGVLFFRADDGVHGGELWKSDGTPEGTVMIKDIYPGPASSNITSFYTHNGILYFNANNGSNGRELWKSDGTEAGTVMIKDIFPGVMTSGLGAGTPHSGNPQSFTAVNDVIFFMASDDYEKTQVWKTDGTEAGTVVLKDFPTLNYALSNFFCVNNNLFFTVYGGTEGNELWKSDGTDAGTVKIKSLFGGNFDNHGVVAGNKLYFLESDGLYISDGTEAGTVLLKERGDAFFNTVELLTVFNGQVCFTGYDPVHGWELWKTDGTPAGTRMLMDINPGSGNSDINCFFIIGDKLMFSANDQAHGNEIWITDGTAAGTKLVQDIVPGPGDAMPVLTYEFKNAFIELNGRIYAGITTASLGGEVWVANMPSEIGLPLELLEFKAWLENTDGRLQWKTEHEHNTSSFVVERSINGQDYEVIGQVAARNTSGTNTYEFTDQDVTSLDSRIAYYRLRQVDLDGSFLYSQVVSLEWEKPASIMLYPNPARSNINLSIYLPQAQKMEWQLTDNLGRMIRYGRYDLPAGKTVVTENVNALPEGIYYLQIKGQAIQKVIRFVRQ